MYDNIFPISSLFVWLLKVWLGFYKASKTQKKCFKEIIHAMQTLPIGFFFFFVLNLKAKMHFWSLNFGSILILVPKLILLLM